MVILPPLLIIIAVLLYGLVHSLLASLEAKSLAQRLFGPTAERFYRLAYNIFAIITLLPILVLPVLLPDHLLYIIPFPWLLLSMFIQGLAILVLFVGLLQTGLWSFLGLEQLIKPALGEPQAPILHGLYRCVRHPLYTAGLVFIWLIPVMTLNLLALNIGLSIYLVAGAYVEERKLVQEFGEAYLDYKEHTPILIPWRPRPKGEPGMGISQEPDQASLPGRSQSPSPTSDDELRYNRPRAE